MVGLNAFQLVTGMLLLTKVQSVKYVTKILRTTFGRAVSRYIIVIPCVYKLKIFPVEVMRQHFPFSIYLLETAEILQHL